MPALLLLPLEQEALQRLHVVQEVVEEGVEE